MKNVTYPDREITEAEVNVKGIRYVFLVPPKTGTHRQCFTLDASEMQKGIRCPTGEEIVAYAVGALDPKRKNEWLNQDLIKFPSYNLRFQNVFTIIPAKKEYGNLKAGMLVDFDEKAEGIEMQTNIPKDLSGFAVNNEGLQEKDGQIFLPYESWYKGEWDGKNDVLASLARRKGALNLEEVSRESGRNYRPLWNVNPKTLSSPIRRVPVLYGCDGVRLCLGCDYVGLGDGCVPRVVIASTEGASICKK